MHRILVLEQLYHHLLSTPEHDSTSIDHLKHDLVLWLTHHSFEDLPDALEYSLGSSPPNLSRSMGSANQHPSTCYHLHQHPPSMGQVFPSHLWGVSRPL